VNYTIVSTPHYDSANLLHVGSVRGSSALGHYSILLQYRYGLSPRATAMPVALRYCVGLALVEMQSMKYLYKNLSVGKQTQSISGYNSTSLTCLAILTVINIVYLVV